MCSPWLVQNNIPCSSIILHTQLYLINWLKCVQYHMGYDTYICLYLSHDIHTESQWLNMCFARNLTERFFQFLNHTFTSMKAMNARKFEPFSILPPSSNSAINNPIVLNKYHTIRDISRSTYPTISPSFIMLTAKRSPELPCSWVQESILLITGVQISL